jgi:indoleacetamide hydrolase
MNEVNGEAGIAALRERLDTGATTAVALVDAALERAAALAGLNLFTGLCADSARAAAAQHDAGRGAAGPLAGIPVVIKDNINTAGAITSAGCIGLANGSPAVDAPVVTRLKQAGAIVLGKTNMHELAFGITSNNPHYGACGNPHAPARIPGGSSGGTAAAVAAGLVAVGLGTDTGGSCRIPAALCGCVGFRPTLNRWPADGVVPIAATRDTPGPFSMNVADAALLDAICAADATPLPALAASGLRLGVPRAGYYENLDADLAAVAEAGLARLEAAGVTLVPVDMAATMTLSQQVGFPVAFYEVLRDMGYYLARYRPEVSLRTVLDAIATPGLGEMLAAQLGEEAIPLSLYHEAIVQARPALQRLYVDCFAASGVDALILPTTPLPAALIGEEEDTVLLNGQPVPTFQTFIRNTDPASNAGQPAISLPCGMTASGLPVGMELVGPAGGDRRLLAVAAAVESVWGVFATVT